MRHSQSSILLTRRNSVVGVRGGKSTHGTACRIFAVAVVAFVPTACREALSADSAITLNETCAVSVPTEGSLSGGSITNDGSILLWTRESSVIWAAGRDDAQARAITLAPGADVVAAAWVNGQIEVVDGGRRRIARVDLTGAVQSVTNVTVPIRLHAAARLPSGWVVGGAGIDGNVALAVQKGDKFELLEPLALDSVAETIGATSGNAPRRDVATGDGFYLAAHGDDAVLISWVVRPHRSAVLKLRGKFHWQPDIPREVLAKMSANKNGWYLWSALPALSSTSGVVVQTISDMGSTNREMLVRGRDGTVARLTAVDAPVGFVGASQSGRTLLAVSRVPHSSALCYEVEQ